MPSSHLVSIQTPLQSIRGWLTRYSWQRSANPAPCLNSTTVSGGAPVSTAPCLSSCSSPYTCVWEGMADAWWGTSRYTRRPTDAGAHSDCRSRLCCQHSLMCIRCLGMGRQDTGQPRGTPCTALSYRRREQRSAGPRTGQETPGRRAPMTARCAAKTARCITACLGVTLRQFALHLASKA